MSAVISCALLDPASSASRAHPLRHWSKARLASVRSHFAEVHRAWCDDWLPGGPSAHAAAEMWIGDGEAETALVPEGTTIFWSFAETTVVVPRYTAVDAISHAMFGSDAARELTGMAGGVARAAWSDWLRRLTASPALEASELQEVAPSKGGIAAVPWSGVLWLRWRWCGGLWRLALPHDVAAALADLESTEPSAAVMPAPPTTGLDKALARERIALRTVLGGAELNLGQLQSLRLGDVIPLDHRLDAPLKVIGADGVELCEGWLGQREGRVAIEMALPARHPPSNPTLKENNQ